MLKYRHIKKGDITMSVKEIKKLEVKYRGEEVSKEDLLYISENYILSHHAQEMIEKRHKDIDVTESIKNPMLAYFNTDGTINCAINEYEYFVISTERVPYKVITFKEKSWYSITIFEKQNMAKDGFDRKY
jgi:hypothetical protein